MPLSNKNRRTRKTHLLSPLLLLSLLGFQPALCNVEKTIFLGPASARIPLAHPTLEDLHIDTLTPSQSSLRTRLAAAPPSASNGKATWLLLDNLTAGQRYEVRVCWAATQPTSFTINTYTLDTVFETPDLITSLSGYSTPRQPSPQLSDDQQTPRIHHPTTTASGEKETSVLFLQIIAAADYFTSNATLMRDVSPVDVDIILDPFVLNVLPRSLVPTVVYILFVAAAAYLVSGRIVSWLRAVVAVVEESGELLLASEGAAAVLSSRKKEQ
ncbi:hypothetical protein B0T22DRAFT_260470 [Podospora appendiculata]|uniref:Uncharacterized protein n=1 Tax=Podospora appendiculata TaxID=314037 RepID=A0AAE0X2Z3_9PEZI|nr:hypothetical protein B0T22DRAFT_260470 [Podospora appendiculata]